MYHLITKCWIFYLSTNIFLVKDKEYLFIKTLAVLNLSDEEKELDVMFSRFVDVKLKEFRIVINAEVFDTSK